MSIQQLFGSAYVTGAGKAGVNSHQERRCEQMKYRNSAAEFRWGVAAAVCLAISSAAIAAARPASLRGNANAAKPAVVLVHGAFSDATAWQRVITLLQRDGYDVTAVENPLESLQGDVATTRRAVEAQTRPVVLVGHSYGGAVITGAAEGNPNVKALVYIAAFAPEGGEEANTFAERYPTEIGEALKSDSAGFLSVNRNSFRDVFAGDVSHTEAAAMAAAQKPINAGAFTASVPRAAWKTIPSWYLVTTEDHAVSPDLQRFYAKRIGAKVTQIRASHAVFVSHPTEVVRLIEQAALAVAKP
jgi:pimeloyl-ACP methyl ester carboxylesterase